MPEYTPVDQSVHSRPYVRVDEEAEYDLRLSSCCCCHPFSTATIAGDPQQLQIANHESQTTSTPHDHRNHRSSLDRTVSSPRPRSYLQLSTLIEQHVAHRGHLPPPTTTTAKLFDLPGSASTLLGQPARAPEDKLVVQPRDAR
jgi:hypothetical protein